MPNDEMAQAFIAAQGEKPARPRRQRQPGTSLAYKSEKQAIKDAKWAGIKEGFLWMMSRYDPDGPHCWTCGRKGNAGSLDLHHTRSRAQGGSFDARNAELLCRECHEEVTGKPQFGGGNG